MRNFKKRVFSITISDKFEFEACLSSYLYVKVGQWDYYVKLGGHKSIDFD